MTRTRTRKSELEAVRHGVISSSRECIYGRVTAIIPWEIIALNAAGIPWQPRYCCISIDTVASDGCVVKQRIAELSLSRAEDLISHESSRREAIRNLMKKTKRRCAYKYVQAIGYIWMYRRNSFTFLQTWLVSEATTYSITRCTCGFFFLSSF